MGDFLLAGLWILLFLFFLVQVVAYYISYSLSHPHTLTLEGSRDLENERTPGLMDLYDTWNIKSYDLEVTNGYKIKIYDVMPEEDTKKYVVIAHGHTYTHHGSIKYAKMMVELGFHVIMFDERYHGASGGKNCTMGMKERQDLYDLITHVYKTYGKDIFLGTYGESMGGATVLLEQAIDKRIKFVISDCAYSDLDMLLGYLIQKRMHLPSKIFLPFVKFYFYVITKQKISLIKPINCVKDTKTPIFYAHGKNDLFIPYIHSERMYEVTSSKKDLFLAGNDARHTGAARKDEANYIIKLKEFIQTIE